MLLREELPEARLDAAHERSPPRLARRHLSQAAKMAATATTRRNAFSESFAAGGSTKSTKTATRIIAAAVNKACLRGSLMTALPVVAAAS